MIPNYQYPYQGYPQYQQPQVVNAQPGLSSRIVDDFGLITANEVPMDGSPAVFLKRDMSQIQVRKWGSDGRIYTSSFQPYQEEKPHEEQISLDVFEERLKGIEDKIDKLLKPAAVKKGATDGN